MAENKSNFSRLELRFFIKLLVAEKCKLPEIYGRMCEAYQEVYFNQNNHYN